MGDMIIKGKQGAKHELKDLEVREVSVVDRPANQRRFLIVKREAAEMASEVTADISVLEDAAALIDLLALGNDDQPAPTPESPPVSDLGGLEEIFKATTAGQAVRQLAPMLQRLLTLVNEMKKLGDKPVPAPMASQLKAVVGALNLAAGKAKAKTEKLDNGKLQGAVKALEKLVALVNRLQAADADSEIGEKEASEIGSIASMLSALIEAAEPPATDDKEAAKKSDDDDSDDPVIVIKAGAKMRKARLSQFRKAVETLSALLKELSGEDLEVDDKKPDDKKKKKTTKSDDPVVVPPPAQEPAEPQEPAWLSKMEELTGKSLQATAALTATVEDLSKRVEGIENVRPVGADDDPPADPIEKKTSLWRGVIS